MRYINRRERDTVLDSGKSEHYSESVEYRLFEAPYNLVNSNDRRRWVEDGMPCFGRDIFELYRLKERVLSKETFSLPLQAEMEERRDFIRYPIVGAFENSSGKPIGGIWIEDIDKLRREALGHIFSDNEVRSNYRGFTDEMFNFFVRQYRKNIDSVRIDFGRRSSDNDPTRFFVRNGFVLYPGITYTSAVYNLR